mmetsp:Transcript_26765/g.72631  ORF Transcript_26765/g.72631 Transcript_26765/m.72631 type:complete len:234 (-) Transcript_26765:700-1401(-)
MRSGRKPNRASEDPRHLVERACQYRRPRRPRGDATDVGRPPRQGHLGVLWLAEGSRRHVVQELHRGDGDGPRNSGGGSDRGRIPAADGSRQGGVVVRGGPPHTEQRTSAAGAGREGAAPPPANQALAHAMAKGQRGVPHRPVAEPLPPPGLQVLRAADLPGEGAGGGGLRPRVVLVLQLRRAWCTGQASCLQIQKGPGRIRPQAARGRTWRALRRQQAQHRHPGSHRQHHCAL